MTDLYFEASLEVMRIAIATWEQEQQHDDEE